MTVYYVAWACVLYSQLLAVRQAGALKRDVAFSADRRSGCRASLVAVKLRGFIALHNHSGMCRGGCDGHRCRSRGCIDACAFSTEPLVVGNHETVCFGTRHTCFAAKPLPKYLIQTCFLLIYVSEQGRPAGIWLLMSLWSSAMHLRQSQHKKRS